MSAPRLVMVLTENSTIVSARDLLFQKRGKLLDEHLGAWKALWSDTPATFRGKHRVAEVAG